MKTIFTFAVVSLLLFVSCSTSQEVQVKYKTLPFSIVRATGGGFSGLYEGIFIDSIGTVYKWSGKTFSSSSKEKLKSLSDDQKEQLALLFYNNDYSSVNQKESGNMVTYISLRKTSFEKTFSWKSLNLPENAPGFLKELNQFLDNILK